jgi:hypothetical protein
MIDDSEPAIPMPMQDSKGKIKNRYIFPDVLAKAMSKVSTRTQMESGILSMSLLVLAMILMVLYMIIWGAGSITYKVILAVNLLCGLVFLSSYLITNYQQYTNYMDNMGFDAAYEKQKIKSKGNIFKRIKLAFQNRKKNKQEAKALENVNVLLNKSGVKNELTDVKDDEISELIKQNLGEEL